MDRRSITIIGVLAALAVVLLFGVRACDVGEPEAPSLIAQADDRAATRSGGSAPTRSAPRGYVKRDGLHIDIAYLGNRRLAELAPDVIEDQLGARLSTTDLPESETHLVFEKAELWTYDGRIYRVRKPLEHPMDIPTAMGTSGFPLDPGPGIDSTGEVRWNATWNQRRIRLIRSADDPRLYVALDVYRFIPKEQR
jgi:hypothetical protein